MYINWKEFRCASAEYAVSSINIQILSEKSFQSVSHYMILFVIFQSFY